ncbi:hypothetical protein HanRHA438_Chr08g0337551 [Helianthus annuus]|nr:hypothetical protein HanRHA438_Chr08g0337551 [Helianthus annuus]
MCVFKNDIKLGFYFEWKGQREYLQKKLSALPLIMIIYTDVCFWDESSHQYCKNIMLSTLSTSQNKIHTKTHTLSTVVRSIICKYTLYFSVIDHVER